MTEQKKEEPTEVVDGSVVPTGGIVHQDRVRNLEEEGVQPQDVKVGTLVVCKGRGCGMEVMPGTKCPYCNTIN